MIQLIVIDTIDHISGDINVKINKLCDILSSLTQILRQQCKVEIPTPTIINIKKSSKLSRKVSDIIDIDELQWCTELCWNISLSLIHNNLYKLSISMLSSTYSLLYILNDGNKKYDLLQQSAMLYGGACIELIWSVDLSMDDKQIYSTNALQSFENILQNYNTAGTDQIKDIVVCTNMIYYTLLLIHY